MSDVLTSKDILHMKNPSKGVDPKSYNQGSVQECIDTQIPYHMRKATERYFSKELKSTDLSTVRFVSLYDEWVRLANDQTLFLNMVEGNGTVRMTDFQVRFNEERIGSDTVTPFNMNSDFPGEAEANRAMRDNTLGFHGNRVDIRLIAQELAGQSPEYPYDAVQREIEFELIRIRRHQNEKLLAQTEVKAETPGNIPNWGGFITRSTANNLATSGDLTNALIQGRVDAIANATSAEGLTYNTQLIALCGADQIGRIEDLMIARWPGETSQASAATLARLSAGLPGAGIAPEQAVVYKPRPGMPIIFIYEPMLPSGYVLFFTPKGAFAPKLARFQIGGQFGPWAIERPVEKLSKVVYVFDAISLIDPLVESRALLTNVG